MPELILASASPRRTELLNQLGLTHTTFPVDIDESPLSDETPENMVWRLAAEKAGVAWARLATKDSSEKVILASDTLIAFNGVPVGKPENQADCFRILSMLSDKQHQVLTAISAKSADRQKTQLICTNVQFAPLTEQDITAYWETGEPADKAGSYAIQGIGGQFVRTVNGSVSAVVGLPLYETRCLLSEFGVVR